MTKFVENEVAGEVVREVTAMAMRDERIDISDGIRGVCTRDANAITALNIIKRTSLPAKSKNVRQRHTTGLTALQAVIALECERTRPVTRAASKRLSGRSESLEMLLSKSVRLEVLTVAASCRLLRLELYGGVGIRRESACRCWICLRVCRRSSSPTCAFDSQNG